MNIEQLIKRGKTKDKTAVMELIRKFTPLVLKTIGGIYINSYDKEDLIQIGYISIIRAIESYDMKKGCSFTAYVSKTVKNNYYYEIRKISKSNYEISYDKISEDEIYFSLVNIRNEFSIEEKIIKKEQYCKLKDAISKLSDEDKEFLVYLLENGHGALKEYGKIKNIKYETLQKRKKKVLEKLKKFILEQE